ncbi:MAG: hypothetical protein AAGC74_05140 [Verrucomicrobiota bacterium]
MFSAKELSEEQVAALRAWAAEGGQLADLQKKLKEEFGLNVTYMDMRFAVLDLGIEIQGEEEEEERSDDADAVLEEASGSSEGGDGKVSVTVDQIAQAGAMVSGTIVFSDGEKGRWLIDAMGRPSLDPDTAGYRPTEEDLMAFQLELAKALDSTRGLGY